MTAIVVVAMLVSVLLLAAFGGPWLLRQAAPALAATPRFAALTLTVAAMVWIVALLALGPVVAWISRGPAWLPQGVAEVCGRCLTAATPFGEPLMQLEVPAVIPLLLPVLGAGMVAAGLRHEFSRLRRTRRHVVEQLSETRQEMTMLGYHVSVLADDACFAFSLPRRFGGIVVSRGAVSALSPAELAAVLRHEETHVRQRHHLVLALLGGATHYFRRIPLIGAVRDAAPHYLEIAADQAAKRETGTTALAGALLKLGTPTGIAGDASTTRTAVLHAAGSERVRLLIGEPRPPASLALAVSVGAYVVMLVTAIVSVHAPYLLAVVAGC